MASLTLAKQRTIYIFFQPPFLPLLPCLPSSLLQAMFKLPSRRTARPKNMPTAVEPERTNRSYHKAHYDTFTIVIHTLWSTCGYITEFWWIRYVYFTPERIIPSYPVIRYQASLNMQYSGCYVLAGTFKGTE